MVCGAARVTRYDTTLGNPSSGCFLLSDRGQSSAASVSTTEMTQKKGATRGAPHQYKRCFP